MRKIRIILSVSLALALLISCFAACGTTDASSDVASSDIAASSSSETEEVVSAEQTEQETTDLEPSAEEPQEEAEEQKAEEEIEEPENYFVADDRTTISVLYKFVSFFSVYWPDSSWETSPWWDALEEATNTKLEFTMFSMMDFNEQALLLASSGSLPDMVPELGNIYSAGLSGALNDDVIYDLHDYLQEYAPHYWKYLNQYGDETVCDVVLDGGKVAAMYSLYNEPSVITDGLWIRDDWLKQINMDVPTTLEDLKTVLTAFKSEFGADAPMFSMIGRNTVAVEMTGVKDAFGSPLGFYSYEGDVRCSYIEDSYRDYITYLKDLAEDGLFITSDVTEKQQAELMASGSIGCYGEGTANIADQIAMIEDPNASYKAMASPGEPSQCGPTSSMAARFYYSVSTNCEHPELVVKMLDYLFTEEGSMLSSYGIEGLSYEYVDGEPMWTDLITNNPDGAPYAGTSTYYLNPGFPALQIANISQKNYANDYQVEAAEIWASGYAGNAKQSLNVSLNEAESDVVNNSLSDMNTYLTETVYAWIFGGQALDDAAWDAYLKTMESMNIQDILEAYQTAYDRYLEREL